MTTTAPTRCVIHIACTCREGKLSHNSFPVVAFHKGRLDRSSCINIERGILKVGPKLCCKAGVLSMPSILSAHNMKAILSVLNRKRFETDLSGSKI